jgi:paraquat-inducible protein A
MSEEPKLNKSPNQSYVFCNTCHHRFAHDPETNPTGICPKCGHKHVRKAKDNNKTLGYAFAALVMYLPANLLPFMTFEMYGNKTQTTIWSGIVSLANSGNAFLGVIIFIASMLVPLIKLIALFYLSLTGRNGKNKSFKTKLFHFIEIIGPWSMLDVFLLAILVAVIKLGSLASVSVGDGSLMFLFVVIFTMLASSNFDSKVIWDEGENNENR